jgi:hypothetical protein
MHFLQQKENATSFNTCMYLARHFFAELTSQHLPLLRSGVIFGNSFPEKKVRLMGWEIGLLYGTAPKFTAVSTAGLQQRPGETPGTRSVQSHELLKGTAPPVQWSFPYIM